MCIRDRVYSPREQPRSRTIIRQSALGGDFTYGTVAPYRTVNVMALAAASNQLSAYDPIVKKLLEDIRAAAQTTGSINELVTSPNTAAYDYLVGTKTLRHTPTVNVTVNLTPKNRLQGSYYYQYYMDTPDTLNSVEARFPGFPAYGDQFSYRSTGSLSLRSTMSTAIVNEARMGWALSPVNFWTNATNAMFENQGGYGLSLGFGLTNAHPFTGPSHYKTPNVKISDTFNWLKGSHAFQFGADYTHVLHDEIGSVIATSLALGFQTAFDPAEAMFTTTNFPGSTSADRNSAKALYSLLTGRVSSISGTGYLADSGQEYVYNGDIHTRITQDDYSFFAQDTWRWKPTVTVTMGLRYQFTLPMNPGNSVYTTISQADSCGPSGIGAGPSADGSTDRFCSMFRPGAYGNPTAGVPSYFLYTKDNKGYSTDFNNLGPVVGIAWRPNVQDGWLRTILGDPEIATVNGGFTRSFVRTTLTNFLTVYDGNPGQTIPATRSTSTTAFPIVPAFAGDTAGWPILYSQKDRLGAPAFNPNPQLPIYGAVGANGLCTTCLSAWIFNPVIEVPWTDSWNVSLQRSINKDTVFEVRYQGNRSYKAWGTENWNTTNLQQGTDGSPIGGDFFNLTTNRGSGEFALLQQNLRANVSAGRGPSMAYLGPNTGTVPVPITFAHFNGAGSAAGGATNPANYTGGIWTSTSLTPLLDEYFPNPGSFAATLYGSSFSSTAMAPGMNTRLFSNALNVGYPTNYWALNPQLSGVNVMTNSSNRPFNHLVSLQVRRRLAEGLAAQVSYTWQRNVSGSLLDYHLPRLYLESSGVPHAIQALYSYDIPVGRGKRYGANMNPWLDGVLGGWTFSGTARFQTQSFLLRNTTLVGMTLDQAKEALSVIRYVTDPVTGALTVFNFPEDIYTNTRLAYDTDETYANYYVPGREPTGPLAAVGPDGQTYRYFAPAGGPGCNFVFTGDCGVKDIRFLGRWFGEMDFRLAKAFQLPGKARFEFSAEIFNATKALNFPNVINPSTSANAFRLTSTQSPARTAQLVWRVTW